MLRHLVLTAGMVIGTLALKRRIELHGELRGLSPLSLQFPSITREFGTST